MVTNNFCPICEGRTKDVEDYDDVCEVHLTWLVTVCIACGMECFSIYPGKCTGCDLKEINRLAYAI
jgi:hypothetical protein